MDGEFHAAVRTGVLSMARVLPASTRIEIRAGDHEAPGVEIPWHVIVNGHGCIVCGTRVASPMGQDRSIISIIWGPIVMGGVATNAGMVTRHGSAPHTSDLNGRFFDVNALVPFVAAHEAAVAAAHQKG